MPVGTHEHVRRLVYRGNGAIGDAMMRERHVALAGRCDNSVDVATIGKTQEREAATEHVERRFPSPSTPCGARAPGRVVGS